MNDLAIEFRGDGGHLYEQIYEYIRNEIREGKLLAGEKLPSTRSLAEYLQVARSTVELAYGQLVSEGYIESVPYRGYFISRVEELYGMMAEMGERQEKVPCEEKKYDIDFSPNAIDMSLFPFGTWRRITKDILNGDRKELFALGMPQGDEAFRLTICRYLHASRGVNASPEQIIVGAGNDYLLLLLRFILGDGIRIAFEKPTYRRAYRIFSSFAQDVAAVPMDENGIIVSELAASGADTVYVMPSHQFPMGITMPIGRRIELLRWAGASEDRYIIEDDYDSEFRYRGKPVPSLQASDSGENVIYLGTFSKSVAPAIRVSYMVLPPLLMKKYERRCGFFSSTVSRIDQTILNEFIQSGAFERYLNKMRKAYKEKHDILLEVLKPLKEEFRLSGEHAGLHVLLTCRKGRGEAELIRKAGENGVRVYGLHESTAQSPGPGEEPATLLLGYAGLEEKEIREGVRRLRESLR